MMRNSYRETDEHYMLRCLQLAALGRGRVSPNPMVGAVIVCDGRIIGEGYHRQYGGPHAEVNAIRSVKDRTLLKRSTIYVSLEPCSHYGKTPPCSQLIIDEGIPRVVVGCLDPYELVSGRGISLLKDAGIEVVTGVLERECQLLNIGFMTVQQLQRPYVILKWAQSSDGFIDRIRPADQPPVIISTPETQMLVHKLRSEVDAIWVGARTAILDNPSLTVRRWSGKNPLRILVDHDLSLPQSLNLFTDGHKTLVFTQKQMRNSENLEYEVIDGDNKTLMHLLQKLSARGVQSVMIEGGAKLLQQFIDEGCWDEARIEIGALQIHEGVKAPQLKNGCPDFVSHYSGSHISRYFNKKSLFYMPDGKLSIK